ncbi:Crp/Fnr family transcriptional regulator [Clostridium sporogenes]|uniref:Crp/Fnr family transcriptional regulator n=2 Tax=Clostridium TaxID=1485 RepID=A0A6M0T4H8_CLOBO|nr:Crp/Fnr family transcriptional regulator [Clostridium sporogenes]NFA61850.1 Crp/Fnr family transcriptional regulator [Clostridium botulinum]MDS1004001.1 Crp/Fnr family transcriptional regulator [Clostridium sporogenes]NFI73891.1 Crp/Fnr family transcriptional regulator [Clostridium sporogenes]NFL71703.1 Crp/Fnr family transcriptional regulator [Clostridium sporogenes]NFM23742.1 Crp/Fnr family transcriptional regulator [Clostridium sporogenes]
MNNNIFFILSKCILFRNFEEKCIEKILKNINYKVKDYKKDEVIAIEGDSCSTIGIILDGSIEIQKLFSSGKTVTITSLIKGDIFGEVIVFSSMNKYPSTILSTFNSKIMFISKEDIVKLCSLDPLILNNLMGLLSNKILMLNKKVRNLSYETIRQKISSFLLEQYSEQNSLTIKLNVSRKALAEIFGIPRPSLSRELINMKNDNLIDFEKNIIIIKDLEALEEILY